MLQTSYDLQGDIDKALREVARRAAAAFAADEAYANLKESEILAQLQSRLSAGSREANRHLFEPGELAQIIKESRTPKVRTLDVRESGQVIAFDAAATA